MDSDKKANREYKDSLFTALFSEEKNAIELYNAIGGKDYPPDIEIQMNMLDDILFFDRVNDISFVIDNKLVVLVEQQASINQNMPLRFLLYICKIYERIIAAKEQNIYAHKLTHIPRPEFICLYNGQDAFPDKKILRLSDAFIQVDEHPQIDMELTVKVININRGKNESILKRSKVLTDYVYFTSRIRDNLKNGLSLEDAINESIKHCISLGILLEFLEQYRSEVINMLTTEFNLEMALKVAAEEAFEEGREEGLEKGLEKGLEEGREEGREEAKGGIIIGMLKMNYPDDDIITITGINSDKLTQYKTALLNI